MWTPFENCRRFVITNPPWVLFVLSLIIMAIGVIILAYHLKNDNEYDAENKRVTQFCWWDQKIKKSKQLTNKKLLGTTSTSTSSANISVSVKLTVYKEFADYLNSTQTSTVRGRVYNGQLGFNNKLFNSSWSFEIPNLNSSVCLDEKCRSVTFQSCLIVKVDDRALLPFGWDGNSCSNFSIDGNLKPAESDEIPIFNEMDFEDTVNPPYVDRSKPTKNGWCYNGLVITVENEDLSNYILFPLVHDTLMARLHLLYTSYFLMVTVLMILCYAMCRRVSKHRQRSFHEREMVDEAQASKYGRLREN